MTDDVDPRQRLQTPEGLDLFDRDRLAPRFFGLLFVAAAAGLLYTVWAFVHDIVLALVLVALFRPLHRRLCGVFRGRRWLASGVVTSLIFVLIAVPLTLLTASLIEQARVVYDQSAASLSEGLAGDGPLAWAFEPTRGLLTRLGIELAPERVHALLERAQRLVQDSMFSAGGSVLSNLLGFVVHASVLFMLVLYLLVDIDRLREFAFKLSPLPDEEDAMLVERFVRVAKGTLVGNGLGSVAQGALCGIAMGVAGLPSPLFWSAVMSILAFLPLLGVSIVVIPCGIYLFVDGSPVASALFLAFCLGQALVIENLVKPHLIGSGAAMPDLLAFMVVVGGIAAFGVLGLLYGPLIATAFLTLTELYFERYRHTMALNYIGRKG